MDFFLIAVKNDIISLRRYAEVNRRVEELEESHSQCEGAEHRIKVQLNPGQHR